jgi:hypothetical protein
MPDFQWRLHKRLRWSEGLASTRSYGRTTTLMLTWRCNVLQYNDRIVGYAQLLLVWTPYGLHTRVFANSFHQYGSRSVRLFSVCYLILTIWWWTNFWLRRVTTIMAIPSVKDKKRVLTILTTWCFVRLPKKNIANSKIAGYQHPIDAFVISQGKLFDQSHRKNLWWKRLLARYHFV